MKQIIPQLIERYNPSTRAEYEQALREILQELVLLGLWRGKFFEHAAFYGGTALRIFHGLDRFSEDLDFTLIQSHPNFSWKNYEKPLKEELESFGFKVTTNEKNKKMTHTAIASAFLKTNTYQSLLTIGADSKDLLGLHPDTLTRVKIEIDTDPIPGLHYEQAFMKEPLPRAIKIVTKPDLFAGKIHAALYRAWKNRVKGRDWWDIVWFVRKEIPLNLEYVSLCMQANNHLEQGTIISKEHLLKIIEEKVQRLDVTAAQNDVRPFIKDKSLVDDWSPEYFMYWLKQIKVQKH